MVYCMSFPRSPGLKEDVTEIILNIKALSAKLNCDGPKVVNVSASGECVVTAGDIVCDEQVEIINPDLVLATLNEDAHLNMEITLCKGRGYVSADRNKTPNMPIGVLPVELHLHPHPQGELHHREHARRPDDGLRQAHPRGVDRRKHQAG